MSLDHRDKARLQEGKRSSCRDKVSISQRGPLEPRVLPVGEESPQGTPSFPSIVVASWKSLL